MDHKAFLSSLTPEERATLTARSDARGLVHLAAHWGAIAVCGLLIWAAVPFWPLLLVVQGVLLVFLFTLLHETSHKTPFQTGWINDAVGHVCGFVLFIPAVWFRYFHLAHHRFTQVPGKDPELEGGKPETMGAYLWHVSGIPLWKGAICQLLGNARGRSPGGYVPDGKRAEVRREAQLYVGGYGVLAGLSLWSGSTVLIYLWLLPILLGQPFLRLYLLAEHGRCPMVADMFRNTRTTFTNRIVRALAWNMPYHAEHHCYPTVPFHQLPALHARVAPYLQETAEGYARFNRDYVRAVE